MVVASDSKTDSTGKVTANVLVGSENRANRTVTVTATSNGIVRTATFEVIGAKIASTVIGAPGESRLLEKPMLQVLHGGGQIFFDLNDPNAKRISFWISRPMPQGQDEFSIAGNSMLTSTGVCLDQ